MKPILPRISYTLIFLLVVGGVVVPGGCGGRPRGHASRVVRRGGAAVHTGWADELSDRKIKLVMSGYGRRLVGMHDRDWRDMVLYSRGGMPKIKWLRHFGPLLELDSEMEDGAEPARMDLRQARAAIANYVTEKIYPVRMSLDIMRGGRRFLLGEYIDSHIRDLEFRRSGGGFELMYKRDF